VLTYTDAEGWHRVTFSLSPIGAGGSSRSFEVLPEVHGTPEVPWTRLPTLRHLVKGCTDGLRLGVLEPTITVTDLDGNGRAEVGFMLVAGCPHPNTPLTLQLHLLEGRTRYSLKGKTFVGVGTDKDGAALTMGGDFTGEETFEHAPKEFLPWATAQWAKFRVVPEAP
jgi:hypothetical protein